MEDELRTGISAEEELRTGTSKEELKETSSTEELRNDSSEEKPEKTSLSLDKNESEENGMKSDMLDEDSTKESVPDKATSVDESLPQPMNTRAENPKIPFNFPIPLNLHFLHDNISTFPIFYLSLRPSINIPASFFTQKHFLPFIAMLNTQLLTSAPVQEFIQSAIKKKMDALQISTALNKAGYSNEDRAAIMDYMALVPKFREKFFGKDFAKSDSGKNTPKGNDVFLLCDRLALEQSTAQDIGKYKANLWNVEPGSVHDLCCGMGGDSYFIPATMKVCGVDLDEDRLAMYRHNIQVMRSSGDIPSNSGETILGDVRDVAAGDLHSADYFTIDPARRAVEGENQRDLRNLTPTFEEVLEISRHYKGGMAKLPPGYPTDEIPQDAELVYLGSHSDCRELLVLFGALAQNPGKVRAIMVDKNGEAAKAADGSNAEWCGELSEIQAASNKEAEHDLPGCERSFRNATSENDLPVGDVAEFIAEPTALLIRSHLFGSVALAAAPEAHLISEGIAYVSCGAPLPTPAFANFQVLDKCEIATSAVRDMLKRHGIGKLTLKLRGVKLDPDEEIKRLKPKGKNEAILFYTRVAGEKTAILAKRV